MKAPITYYGGKLGMIKVILPLIPEHNTYTEAFAGGAAVFFAKPLARINVLNDLNGELINFYRTASAHGEELIQEIEQTLFSREQLEVAGFIYNHADYFSMVERAWAVWTLSHLGFSGTLSDSFVANKNGRNKKAITVGNAKAYIAGNICEIRHRLEQCTIEQDNAFKVIQRYDTPDTFHFIDPPYVGRNMGHYAGMFNEENLHELLELLTDIQGKFMLTMYPNESIQQYATTNHWTIHTVERTITASNATIIDKRKKQEEWMVCNY